ALEPSNQRVQAPLEQLERISYIARENQGVVAIVSCGKVGNPFGIDIIVDVDVGERENPHALFYLSPPLLIEPHDYVGPRRHLGKNVARRSFVVIHESLELPITHQPRIISAISGHLLPELVLLLKPPAIDDIEARHGEQNQHINLPK